jgi:hypothetical protein
VDTAVHAALDESDEDHRPSVYPLRPAFHRYRPSSLGSCIRELVAARLGLPAEDPSEDSLRVMREGRLHEPSILEAVRVEYGWTPVKWRVRMPCGPFAETGGMMDGRDPGLMSALTLVEAKAPGRDAWEEFHSAGLEGHEMYSWQTSAYWWGASHTAAEQGLPQPAKLVVAYKNRDNGKIAFKEYWAPQKTRQEVEDRVLEVESIASVLEALAAERAESSGHPCGFSRSDLPRCDRFNPWCRFSYLHDRVREGGVDREDGMLPLVEAYRRYAQERDRFEALAAAKKEEIVRCMDDRRRVLVGDCRVRLQEGKTRIGVDLEKLRTKFPSAWAACHTTTRGASFYVVNGPRGACSPPGPPGKEEEK